MRDFILDLQDVVVGDCDYVVSWFVDGSDSGSDIHRVSVVT